MLIGIDAREIQKGVVTGIGRLLNNFLCYFDKGDDEHRIILFSEMTLPVAFGARIIPVVHPPAKATILWDQMVLPRLMKKYHVDLFFSPYYKVPLIGIIPAISTISDVMYIYYPVKWRGTSAFSRLYYRIFGGLMTAKAYKVFTSSEYSKTEILRFYHVHSEKVQVIYNGLSDKYQPCNDTHAIEMVKRKFGITAPYLLYVGNFKPHKNVATLIEAFEKVRESIPDLELVLAGNKDRHFATIDDRIRRSPHAQAIVATGLVAQDEQIALYSAATAFVFPSLYEGFGYPPLEAMACGAPVVSSDRTSLSEIIGDAALRCNPVDAADIAEKIVLIVRDNVLRKQCIERGLRRARAFTNTGFCEKFYAMLLSSRT
jgi:glycosyltransferase involved in cell wall biosynthesis